MNKIFIGHSQVSYDLPLTRRLSKASLAKAKGWQLISGQYEVRIVEDVRFEAGQEK